MWNIAANFRRTYSLSRLAWSEGWRPPVLSLHSSDEPGELSQWLWSWWQHHKHCHGYYYYYYYYYYGCVPDQFGVGIVVPLVKDSLGNANDSANYRGITLSVFLSKMFDYCLINKYENFMPSSDLQFGFKKKMGCSHAIFALHQCVDYFVKTGSSVFTRLLLPWCHKGFW